MQPKEYQRKSLEQIGKYLDLLSEWREKAVKVREADPDLDFDFAAKAWEKAETGCAYHSRRNGLNEWLPTFCMKVPTGGGKTFMSVKAIDLVNICYRKRKTGLILWIVPTTQIYRQTIQSLKDRDHPYRQHLDIASGGHTTILEKTDRFTPLDIEESLCVLMLMLPSANRQTKETLRVFKDNGGFQDFFPPDEDIKKQEDLLAGFPNLDTYEKQHGFWGRQIKTSLGNTLRLLSPLIILDEGHKAYSDGAQQTLRDFNPCMIVELSATPTKGSNVLVDISGRELLREEMIKLDLHVMNKASVDWKDTLLASFDRRAVLEEKAHDYEADTGVRIRPICLIQVERTGAAQRGGRHIHSEDVREHLIRQLGVDEKHIAIKTSEKDELKAIDDVGGLMGRDCSIRFIITKQALQEGWDCAFAYVLVVLTNPSSKNAMTQLVGRILRQPFARKTHVRELDESYVYCFQQKAQPLLKSIRDGFGQEGLGDLKGQIVSDDDGGGVAGAKDAFYGIRDHFKAAASRTILPVFVVRDNGGWRAVNYEMDISSQIDWMKVRLDPVLNITLSMYEDKDIETVATLSDDEREVIRQKTQLHLKEGGIKLDPVFMTRQICDIVPNPWRAHEYSEAVMDHFLKTQKKAVVANNFVFLIEELRKQLLRERDRLAEAVFSAFLKKDQLRFLLIGKDFDFQFPERITVKPTSKRLNREDGGQLELSLFEFVPEEDFNDTERAVAWYLETQRHLFFWYRNRSRHDYAIQGWREHKIYPDFIFTAGDKAQVGDYDRVYIVETKGKHLMGNDDTEYKQKVFSICNREAQSRSWTELGLQMKDKVLRFEVLPEDEWQTKLNEILEG